MPIRSAYWFVRWSTISVRKNGRAWLWVRLPAPGPARAAARQTAGRAGATVRSTVTSDRAVRDPLPIGDRLRDHLGHHRAALHLGALGGLRPGRGQARVQLGDRDEPDAVLTERRQHLADEPQERRIRPDHQNSALFQLLTMRVKQKCGPVQRDRGLAGARTALDDQDSGQLGADDPVLVGLDRLHDRLHPAGPPGLQRLQQDGLADHAGAGLGRVRRVPLQVELLVLDVDHFPQPGLDVPAPDDAVVRHRGRDVERPCGGRTPVDQQGFVVRVVQADPADVQDLAVGSVEAAEVQALLGRVQPGLAQLEVTDPAVALVQGLGVAGLDQLLVPRRSSVRSRSASSAA